MRASLRRRSPDALGAGRGLAVACGTAVGLALVVTVGVGWATDGASTGSSVEARAVAAARQAAARAETRAQAVNATAGVVPAKAAPAKAVAPAKVVVPAKHAAPAKAAAPPKVVAPAKPHPATAKPAVGTAARQPLLATGGRPRVAAVAASTRPTLNPVPAPSPSSAHLDDQVTYQYNALGRRDPFLPLLGGMEYVPIDSPPDVGGIKVVGIVWGTQDKFAIIEDGRGNSSVLRPGDKVMNGVVEGLKRDGLIVSITVDGQSQSVTIPLTRKGDSNANR